MDKLHILLFTVISGYLFLGCDVAKTSEQRQGTDTESKTFDPNSTEEQVFSAGEVDALSGAAATFPPGALAIETNITIEEGSSLANDAVLADLGIEDLTIEDSGTALMVTNDADIDASVPFTLNIPLPGQTSLVTMNNYDFLIVLATIRKGGKTYRRVIPRSKLSITDNQVVFSIKYFGKFQALILSQELSESAIPEDKEVEPKILSKAEEESLPTIEWTNISATFNEETRTVAMSATLNGFGTIKKCALVVDANKKFPWNGVEYTTEPAGEIFISEMGAIDGFGLIACVDTDGRISSSPWSPKSSIVKADGSAFDKTPPDTTGASFSTTVQSATAFDVSWTLVTDNLTASDEIAYEIYYSSTNNIQTLSDVLANGTKYGGILYDTTSGSVDPVSPGEYYINIVVTDNAGNQAAYSSAQVITCTQSLSGGETRGCPLVNADDTSTLLTGIPAGVDRLTSDGSILYFTDPSGHRIYQYDLTNPASVLAGSGSAGSTDATGASATFDTPKGLVYLDGDLFIADSENHRIRQIDATTAVVSTYTGSTSGFVDNVNISSAQFDTPADVTSDDDHLYIADFGNHRIRKINISSGMVTTLAGSGTPGTSDGTGAAAEFNQPVAVRAVGNDLYVVEFSDSTRLRKVDLTTAEVTTITLTPTPTSIRGFAADGTYLYIATTDHIVVRLNIANSYSGTVIGGSDSTSGFTDGGSSVSLFNTPTGLLAGPNELFVIDQGNNAVRQID